jgi:hypothetical protein
VSVSWQRDEESFAIEVDSPADTPVEIVLPDGSTHTSDGGTWKHGELTG